MTDYERPALVCMRLTEMLVRHPKQIERTCKHCGEIVGIFPSGQAVLAEFPSAEIICHVCFSPDDCDDIQPAPGAIEELQAWKTKNQN